MPSLSTPHSPCLVWTGGHVALMTSWLCPVFTYLSLSPCSCFKPRLSVPFSLTEPVSVLPQNHTFYLLLSLFLCLSTSLYKVVVIVELIVQGFRENGDERVYVKPYLTLIVTNRYSTWGPVLRHSLPSKYTNEWSGHWAGLSQGCTRRITTDDRLYMQLIDKELLLLSHVGPMEASSMFLIPASREEMIFIGHNNKLRKCNINWWGAVFQFHVVPPLKYCGRSIWTNDKIWDHPHSIINMRGQIWQYT